MDWITGIQKAVDYVESHILETIDFEEVAKQAHSSSFHFQKIFSILCGYTLGNYIRMRRLSLAGKDLSSSSLRVIDVALKYGYETPESFSRAFTRFHGVSPSQVKKGGVSLKAFSQISVKLVMEGGETMKYRIEKTDAFKIICKKMCVSSKLEVRKDEISSFWKACNLDNTFPALTRYQSRNNPFGNTILGITFGNDVHEKDFPYAIGCFYNGEAITDESLNVEEIPAHTYAVFTCVGIAAEAFPKLCQQIFTEFFPTSDYKPCNGPDIEAYPSTDVNNPDYTCEIWVAVEKKKDS